MAAFVGSAVRGEDVMSTGVVATTTQARQRELWELMERFIGFRRRAFIPRNGQIAAELGISDGALAFLTHTRQISEGDYIALTRLHERLTYATKERWRPYIDEYLSAGLMVAANGGWRLTPRGLAAIDRTWNEIQAHLRSLPLPADAVRRVLGICERTAKDVTARGPERLAMIRRCAPPEREAAHEAVRAEQAIFETCILIDDAHIGAWQRAGYRGPTIDVLTRVWYGATTHDALVDALKTTQEPVDVDRHIDELVTGGDLARNGGEVTLTSQGRESRERIEVETNDVAFARWPKGDELEQMFVDVKALLAALPPEEQLPRGKTH